MENCSGKDAIGSALRERKRRRANARPFRMFEQRGFVLQEMRRGENGPLEVHRLKGVSGVHFQIHFTQEDVSRIKVSMHRGNRGSHA